MILGENESIGRAPHDALVKSKNHRLVLKSAAYLCEYDLVRL
jgi:hypothetical protein